MPENMPVTRRNTSVRIARAIARYPDNNAKEKVWRLFLENNEDRSNEYLVDSLVTICLKQKVTLKDEELKTILEAEKSHKFVYSLVYTGLYEVSENKLIAKEMILKYRPELPPEAFSTEARKLFVKSAIHNYSSIKNF